MNEKMITITRTLTEDEAREYLNECHEATKQADSKTGFYQLMEIYKLIKPLLALSDRELFLAVMTEHWKPKKDDTYYFINKNNGAISSKLTAGFEDVDYKDIKEFVFAPTKELAEMLSQVITGGYKPTFEDISENVPFWRWIPQDKSVSILPMRFTIWRSEVTGVKLFFTKEQAHSFARQQEEKRADKAQFFLLGEENGILCFDAGGRGKNQWQADAVTELNRIRTELARLSQLLPKE